MHPAFEAALDEIERMGPHLAPRSETGLSPYSAIGGRSNSRWWLIPLHPSRVTVAGLDLFQPLSFSTILAKRFVQGAILAKLPILWSYKKIWIGENSFLADIFDRKAVHCAYFTGTDGPHRKTTVQCMNEDGSILGYAKVSTRPRVQPFLRSEAEILKTLADLKLMSVCVPKLLYLGEINGAVVLVTDAAPGRKGVSAPNFGPAHAVFLQELARKTAKPGDGVATLAALSRATETLRPKLENEWIARIAAGISRLAEKADALPVAMAHGDFTPWNSFLVRGRLYVFDWEYAHPAYPLGYDEIHFTLSANPTEMAVTLLQSLETALAARWYDGDHARAAQALLFSLLLHASFYLGRAVAAGGDARDWEEAPRRAAMIDALLSRNGEVGR